MSIKTKHTLVVYYEPMSKDHENWMIDHLDCVVLDINHRDYQLKAIRMFSGTNETPAITFTPKSLTSVSGSEYNLNDIDPFNTDAPVVLYKFKFTEPAPEGFNLKLKGAHWDTKRMQFCPDGNRTETKVDKIGYHFVLTYTTDKPQLFEEKLKGVVIEQEGRTYNIYSMIRVHSKPKPRFCRVWIDDLYFLDQAGNQLSILGRIMHHAATGTKTILRGLLMNDGNVPVRVSFAEADGATIDVDICDSVNASRINNFSDDPRIEDACQKTADEVARVQLANGETKALCPVCVGSGMTNWYVGDKVRTEPCKVCAGSGYVNEQQFDAYVEKYGREHVNSADDKSKIRFVRFCQHCSGTGKIMRTDAGYEVEGKCLYCDGTGRLVGYPAVAVKTGFCGGAPIEDPAATPDIQIDKEYIKNLVQQFVQQILAEKNLGHVEADNWRVNGHDTGIPLEPMDARAKMFEERYARKGQTPLPNILSNGPVFGNSKLTFDENGIPHVGSTNVVQPKKRTTIYDFMTGKTRQTPESEDKQNKTITLRPVKDATTPLAHVQVHGVSKTQADGLYKSIWTVAGGAHSVVSAQRAPDEQWTVVRSLTLSGTMCATDVEIMAGGIVLVKDQAQISNVRLYPGSRLILKDQARAMLVYNYGGVVEDGMGRCSFAATLSEDLYFDQEVAIFEQACHKRMQVANGGKAIAFYGSTTIDTRVRSRGIFIAEPGSTHIGMKVCAGGILVAKPGAKLIDLVTDKDSEVYFLNGAIMIQPRLQGTVYTKTGEVKDLDVASTVVNWLPHNGDDLSFFSLKQYNEEELENVTRHSVCL